MTDVSPINHVPTVPYDSWVSRYTAFGSYFEPLEFTDWRDESMSWKETCYIGDWSPMTKIRVTGPDAVRFFSDLAVNSFAAFEVGQAKHAIFCNSQGKVTGEGVLMRESEDSLYFTSGFGVVWAKYHFEKKQYDAVLEDVTTQHTIQQIQGPRSLELLEEVTGEDLRDIRFMRFRKASIDGMEFWLLRQGMSGDIGYEIHGRWDEGSAVYQRIVEAGQKYGIRRLGGRTKMVNHVEACFPTPSVDFVPAWFGPDEEDFRAHAGANTFRPLAYFTQHGGSAATGDPDTLTKSPVELGWGRNIKFDHDFIGADALREEVANPRRTMRTLVWNADDVVDVIASYFRTGQQPYDFMEWPRGYLGKVVADRIVTADGVDVGTTTSRCYSYYFRAMISLAVIDVAHAEVGTELAVVWGAADGPQKIIRATVAAAPYKTDRRRADVSDRAGSAASGVHA
jgi:glycine cleavage system aminomethyltransferase T